MSAGCPVIAAGATALPALVAGGGMLIDPDDVETWAREMNRLFSDRDARSRLAQAGAARARELAAVDPVEPLIRAYQRAVA